MSVGDTQKRRDRMMVPKKWVIRRPAPIQAPNPYLKPPKLRKGINYLLAKQARQMLINLEMING